MIKQAVELLRAGKLVAFPTETVYGLGADATNADAVAGIFRAKGRPSNNPLIVHVASIEIARRYAEWNDRATILAERFWPGPLTLVLPKRPIIADNVTAGGATVGVRVPDHPLARDLLRAFDGPVAAPSANRSNHVSPTTAQHVRDELGTAVDLILDGGPCTVGIESTVLDLASPTPRVLRPGHVTREQIEQVLGISLADNAAPAPGEQQSSALRSPGQLPVHYAPVTPAYRLDPSERSLIDLDNAAIIELTLDPETYARNLYARLRLLDTQGLRAIYVELPPDAPAWRAVRDRVLRATKPLGNNPAQRR